MKSVLDKYTVNFLKRNKFEGVESNQLSLEQKSIIVSSILAGITPQIIMLEEVDNGYLVLSENEKVSTLIDFIRGNFEISSNTVSEKLLDNKFVGKSFFDFTDCEKGLFLEKTIAVVMFRKLSDIERDVIKSLNEKQSLKVSDISQQTVIEKDVSEKTYSNIDVDLEKQLKHKLFSKVNAELTNDLILQFLMISEDGAVSDFSTKKMLEFKSSLSKVDDLSKTFNYLDEVFVEKTSYLKRAHLPMIYVCANCAINQKVKATKFKEVMDSFYDNVTENYRKACNSRSSAKVHVNLRLSELMNHYNAQIGGK